MRRLFSSDVMELVPSPYFWFSANPAIVFALFWKLLFGAPHVGHCQSDGRSCAAVPVRHVKNHSASCALASINSTNAK